MPCRKRSSSRATIIAANNYYAQSAQTPSVLITTCEGMKKTIWPLRMKMSMTLHAGISFPLGNIKVNDDDGHPLSNFNQRLVSPSLTVHCFTYANQIERIKTPLQGKRKRKGVLLKLILINMKGLFALIEETNTDHCPTLLHLSFPFGISVAICVGKCLDTSSERVHWFGSVSCSCENGLAKQSQTYLLRSGRTLGGVLPQILGLPLDGHI